MARRRSWLDGHGKPVGQDRSAVAAGSDDYNLNLSRGRAQAVATFLKEHVGNTGGHYRVLLGKGEKHPVAPDKKSDGSDNPSGSAKEPPRHGQLRLGIRQRRRCPWSLTQNQPGFLFASAACLRHMCPAAYRRRR